MTSTDGRRSVASGHSRSRVRPRAIDGPMSPSAADTELVTDLGFLIANAAARVTLRTAALLRERFDLRVRAYSILALVGGPHTFTQREIAACLSLDPSVVVDFVDELEDAGLVGREVDPRDRRNRLIVPTAVGRQRLDEVRAMFAVEDEARITALEPGEREVFERVLRRIVFDA